MASSEKQDAGAGDQPVLRVAILGSSTVRVLRASFAADIAHFLPGHRVETYEVPYGQLRQAVIDASSPLRQFQPQVAVFCDRLEDLVGLPRLDGVNREQLVDLVNQYAELIASFQAANGGWLIVHRFALLQRPVDERGGQSTAALVDELNELVAERLARLPQILWVDVASETAAETNIAVDPMLWYLARMPFSESLSRRLARRWCGLVLAAFGKTARVILLDLDNTLWGGVLGEEGLAGVRIGGDYPGNAYLAFQRTLKAIAERGVALAVCSKNDGDLAIKALDTLPEMLIRASDLVAQRINWRPKWQNIQEIADDLNLGLESLLFIDDDAIEREAIRHKLPAVKVLDLPASPAGYADALMNCPWLEVATVTAEDKKRVASYQASRRINEERRAAGSLDDFYAGLGMQVCFQPLSEVNIARAAQLSQKTNQFNTTTRRYDQRDLRRIVEEGGDVVVIGLADRYTEFENIGLLILKPSVNGAGQASVDNYLLSCRVLGRGLETTILRWAVGRAAARNWLQLCGVVIETERNGPVRSVFSDSGFAPADRPGEWTIETKNSAALPKWITVSDQMPSVGSTGEVLRTP